MTLIGHMLDAALPRRCASCGTPLARQETQWCSPCAFTWIRHAALPLQRFGGRVDWAFGWSWLSLGGAEERQLVHALKYAGDPQLGIDLGRAMAREWSRLGSASQETKGCWSVVTIPLHRKRQRSRGYNQSELLAKGWHTVTGMAMHPLLIRKHSGRSLTGFGRSQRVSNLDARFHWGCPPDEPMDTTGGLIIMDDVVTTGSTLEHAHHALRQHWQGPIGFVTLADAAA